MAPCVSTSLRLRETNNLQRKKILTSLIMFLLAVGVKFGDAEIAGLDNAGLVDNDGLWQGWTLQDWTLTDEVAGVDIAGQLT